jgi:hypothetical protein
MGEVMSTNVLGSKSIKNHKQKDANYLDPKNKRSVKNELYQLYIQEKLIHIEKYNELESQMNRLLELTKSYSKQIQEYKYKTQGLKDKVHKLENKINRFNKKDIKEERSDENPDNKEESDKYENPDKKDVNNNKEDLDQLLRKD